MKKITVQPGTQPTYQLRLLGPPELRRGARWQPLPLDKRGALLFYLGYRGDWVSRERLAFLFWPDSPDDVARRNLRQLVKRTKELGYHGLDIETRRVRWALASDVAALREALGGQRWHEVIVVFRGELGEGLSLTDDGGFGAWLEHERSVLARAWQEAALAHADELQRQQRYAEAAALLRRLVAHDNLAEDALQAYLKSAYLAGQRDEALQAYQRFADRLEVELGLEPMASTRELLDTIRASATLQPTAAVVTPPELPLTVLRPPRLVGRRREVDIAATAITPLLLIRGEAGVGKSRFVTELAPDAPVLRCREGLQQVPYHPLPPLLRSRWQPSAASALGDYLDDLARLVPDLVPDRRPAPLDPQIGKTRLLEALARYLGTVAGAGAYALIVDDLHWADAATVELLVYLTQQSPLRVVASYRSDEVDEPLAATLRGLRSNATEITLEPLEPTAFRELLADLSNVEVGPEAFSRWLANASGGNPMFALELLKSLFESGVLRADAAGWRSSLDELTVDYHELQVPRAVAEVVARRVARLSEEALRVLHAAAVLGDDVDPQHLATIAGLSSLAVLDGVEACIRAHLLQQQGFAHHLVRQSIYASLGSARRTLLHARAFEALRASGEASAAVLAAHAAAAGNLEAAVRYGLAAGDEACALLAYEDAVRHYRKVSEMLAPDAPERIPALEKLGDTLLLLGQPRAAEEAFEQAYALLPDSGPLPAATRQLHARLRRKIAETWGGGADQDEQRLHELDRAEALLGAPPTGADASGTSAASAWWSEFLEIHLARSRKLYGLGRLDALAAEIDRLAPVIESYADAQQRHDFYHTLVLLRSRQERFALSDETWQAQLRCVDAARSGCSPITVGRVPFHTGFVALWRGDLATAEKELKAALAFAERGGLKLQLVRTLAYLSILKRRRGQLGNCTFLAERTLTLATEVDTPQYAAVAEANQAWAALHQGDRTAARELAGSALARWRTATSYPFRWLALLPLLRLALDEQALEQAAAAANELLEPHQMKLPDEVEKALRAGLATKAGAATKGGAAANYRQALTLAAESNFD